MKAKEILQAALTAFGPNGENWVKGYSVVDKKGCAAHICWLAAGCPDHVPDLGYANALGLLRREIPETGESIGGYNDLPSTTFPDIKSWFERAIAAA